MFGTVPVISSAFPSASSIPQAQQVQPPQTAKSSPFVYNPQVPAVSAAASSGQHDSLMKTPAVNPTTMNYLQTMGMGSTSKQLFTSPGGFNTTSNTTRANNSHDSSSGSGGSSFCSSVNVLIHSPEGDKTSNLKATILPVLHQQLIVSFSRFL